MMLVEFGLVEMAIGAGDDMHFEHGVFLLGLPPREGWFTACGECVSPILTIDADRRVSAPNAARPSAAIMAVRLQPGGIGGVGDSLKRDFAAA
jgi:hypothetical protein